MGTFGDLMKKAEQEGATFELLDAGNYVGKIIESEYKSSSTGKPMIKTRWEVVAGPKAGFKGLWNYFTLSVENPNALAIFYRQMTSMGLTQEFMQSLANTDSETAMKHIAQALEGRAALLKVSVDKEYNNNKIDRINPVPPEYASQVAAPAPADPFAGAAGAPPAAPAPAPQAAPATAPAPAPPAAPSAPTQEAAPAPPPPPF